MFYIVWVNVLSVFLLLAADIYIRCVLRVRFVSGCPENNLAAMM